MTFLNSTMHPEAPGLLAAILMGSEYDISALKSWRDERDYSDEQAAVLYDRILKEFEDNTPDSIPMSVATSKVSRALWEAAL